MYYTVPSTAIHSALSGVTPESTYRQLYSGMESNTWGFTLGAISHYMDFAGLRHMYDVRIYTTHKVVQSTLSI